MKLITTILLLSSTLAIAQPAVKVGEDSQGSYRIKRDSFVIYKEKEGEYIGLTGEVISKKTARVSGYANYKMLRKDCNNEGNFEVLRVNDYDTQVISKHKITFNDNNIVSAMAGAICNYAQEVAQNPELNNNSMQAIEHYAQLAPDNKWSKEMIVREKSMTTLTESIKFEDSYISIILRVRYPAKTTEYYKLYMDKEFCRTQKGYIEMKTISAVEMEDIPFDFKKPPTDTQLLHFYNIGKNLCDYAVKNNGLRKVIRLEDFNKSDENFNMFERK